VHIHGPGLYPIRDVGLHPPYPLQELLATLGATLSLDQRKKKAELSWGELELFPVHQDPVRILAPGNVSESRGL